MTDHSALIERLEAAKRSTMLGGETCFVPVPLVDEVAAALRDLTEWRDIATAPRDGTWILVATSQGRSVPVCWCFSERGFWASGIGPNLSDPSDLLEYLPFIATHWLPLPSAPNQAKEAGE